MLDRKTNPPIVTSSEEGNYTIIGVIDHGMEIPSESVESLEESVSGSDKLLIELTKSAKDLFHSRSSEILVLNMFKDRDVSYFSGNDFNENIGDALLEYVPIAIADVYIPCLSVRNSMQFGYESSEQKIVNEIMMNRGRFPFLTVGNSMTRYMDVLEYWHENNLRFEMLDDFSYDFEKFVGDVREYEFWKKDMDVFMNENKGSSVAVCCGEYHVPFVKSILDGKDIAKPNWATHIDTMRDDSFKKIEPEYIKSIYRHLQKALGMTK